MQHFRRHLLQLANVLYSIFLGDGEMPRVSPGWILPVYVDIIAGCNCELTYGLGEFFKTNLFSSELVNLI